MKEYQIFNKKTDSWVKMRESNGIPKIVNVKQREPIKPFKGVKKRY